MTWKTFFLESPSVEDICERLFRTRMWHFILIGRIAYLSHARFKRCSISTSGTVGGTVSGATFQQRRGESGKCGVREMGSRETLEIKWFHAKLEEGNHYSTPLFFVLKICSNTLEAHFQFERKISTKCTRFCLRCRCLKYLPSYHKYQPIFELSFCWVRYVMTL